MDAEGLSAPHGTVHVRLRYWAGARAAAGVEQESFEVSSLRELRDEAVIRHPELEPVLPLCSFLLDGVRVDADAVFADGALVEALPPFAGG